MREGWQGGGEREAEEMTEMRRMGGITFLTGSPSF